MPYVTLQQMIDRFGEQEMIELTNLHSPDNTAINIAAFNAAMLDAESEMNSYIGIAASLPLASVPVVLNGKAADVTRYYLDTIDPRADVRQRYEDAIEWLKMLANGQVSIGLDDAGDSVAGGGLLRASTNAPMYTRSTIDSKVWS
jgi:phage gp36-like protein